MLLNSSAAQFNETADTTRARTLLENTLQSAASVMLMPEWRGVFAWNEFDSSIVCMGVAPIPSIRQGEHLKDEDITSIRLWCSTHYSVNFSRQNVFDAIGLAARSNPFHPVRDYLLGVAWDRVSRAQNWLGQFCGVKATSAEHQRLIRAVAKQWLISCVARIFEPGCKVDTMLILEGRQGIGKSRALRTLAGADFFSDSLIDFATKDACQNIQGVWVYELSELDALLRSETSATKAFLSRSFDRFRAPYARAATTVQRSTVFCGTVNHGGYLTDRTGNRRFWTVRCGDVIDVDGIAATRDQLWAEATVLYKNGAQWHLERAEESLMRDEHEDRLAIDPWQETIADWIASRGSQPFSIESVLSGALKLNAATRNPTITRRAHHILEHLGFERQRRSFQGRRTYRYVRGASPSVSLPDCPSATEAAKASVGDE